MEQSDTPYADQPVLVSVLTPTFNEAATLRSVLTRFLEQSDPGGPIEFLIIDGRSHDSTASIVEDMALSDPRIRLLDNPKRLTSFALNVGLKAARGEYIARMDAHALYPPDYLRQAVQRLRDGDAVHVSGAQIAVGRDPWSHRVAAALSTPLGVGGARFRRDARDEVEVDSGFTGVWHRSTLEHYGGWDELAYPNEDGELAARIRRDGGRIVMIPAMAASYVPRNSIRGLARQYWRYGRARARTARRHRNSVRPSHALPPLVLLAATTALIGPRRPRKLARLGLMAYGSALARAAVHADCGDDGDRKYVPLVLLVMHGAWGAGYLLGLLRPMPAVRSR